MDRKGSLAPCVAIMAGSTAQRITQMRAATQ